MLFAPQAVALDTSFVVDALIGTQPRYLLCRRYLLHLIDENTSFVFSELLEFELAEATFQIGLKERHPKNWKRARHDGRARRRAGRLMDETMSIWAELLQAVRWRRMTLGPVAGEVPKLMKRFGLASYDAVHVATALDAEVRDLLTLDVGFAAVPAFILTLHVHGTAAHRIRTLRAS